MRLISEFGFRFFAAAGLAVALVLPASPVAAEGAHEHGVASLDVVLDESRLVISLDSPLDNLLGFEHAPRNEKQRSAVKKMEATLQAADLFGFDAAAGCAPGKVEIVHPFAAGQPAQKGGHDHADAEVSWAFTCATPAALKSVEVRLFDRFSHLKTLRVQFAGPRGQTSATLSRAKRRLSW
jgi:hypothetical protein